MPTQVQANPNPIETFEARLDRGADYGCDLDEAASRLATTEVMRLFLRRRAVLLGLAPPLSTPGACPPRGG